MKKEIIDRLKACGDYSCDGGVSCWECSTPDRKDCEKCFCAWCIRGKCQGKYRVHNEKKR